MRASGKYPDCHVFPSVLKSCTLLMDLRLGESVHACIVRLGMDFDLYTGNALMSMYSKFESMCERGVRHVFDKTPERREIGKCRELNCRIVSEELESEAGMLCFDRNANREKGVGESLINNNFDNGNSNELINNFEKQIMGIDHSVNLNQIKDELLQMNDSYKRTGGTRAFRMDSVRKIFDLMPNRDLVSWNTVIAGNAQNGMYEEALAMIREMGGANLKPDSFTLSSVLPIFAEYVNVRKGKEIHGYAIRHGFDADLFIGSSLIDMYAKCTRVEDSSRVFNLLPQRDSISWNSIIAGCVQNGKKTSLRCRTASHVLFGEQSIHYLKEFPQQSSFIQIAICILSLTYLTRLSYFATTP
nr:putative pentatricopeptide repeat-containing protein [Quercus suber]